MAMQTQDNAQFHILLIKGRVEKEGKYLLAKRSPHEIQAGGDWALPGGKVETEDMADIIQKTLADELREEVGIEITNEIQLIGNGAFTRDDGAHVVGMTFVCHYASGEAQPLEDTTEVKWMSIEELEALTDIKPFLKKEIDRLRKYINSQQ